MGIKSHCHNPVFFSAFAFLSARSLLNNDHFVIFVPRLKKTSENDSTRERLARSWWLFIIGFFRRDTGLCGQLIDRSFPIRPDGRMRANARSLTCDYHSRPDLWLAFNAARLWHTHTADRWIVDCDVWVEYKKCRCACIEEKFFLVAFSFFTCSVLRESSKEWFTWFWKEWKSRRRVDNMVLSESSCKIILMFPHSAI